MSEPTYGTLDLGQPGGSRYTGGSAVAMIRVEHGEPSAASAEFAFPGVDGVYRSGLGMRSQPIVWHCEVQAGESVLAAIDAEIRELVRAAGSDSMTFHGQTRLDVVLDRYIPRGPRERLADGGMFARFDLVFKDLNP